MYDNITQSKAQRHRVLSADVWCSCQVFVPVRLSLALAKREHGWCVSRSLSCSSVRPTIAEDSIQKLVRNQSLCGMHLIAADISVVPSDPCTSVHPAKVKVPDVEESHWHHEQRVFDPMR